MSAGRPKQKTPVQANNLSVKLLKSIGSLSLESNDKPKLNNLKNLANRIKMANQSFKPDLQKRETIKEDLLLNNIDLQRESKTASNLKFRLSVEQSMRQVKEAQPQTITLDVRLDNLAYEELLYKTEQNAAYRAIYESVTSKEQKSSQDSTLKNESRLKQIKRKNTNRIKNIKEEAESPQASLANADLKKSNKLSLNQIRNRFANFMGPATIDNIHQQLYQNYLNRQLLNDRFSERWLGVLYYQVQMMKILALKLNDPQVNMPKGVNYLSTATLAPLDKIFQDIYKGRLDKFQQGYFSSPKDNKQTNNRWAELYFMLRSDKQDKFIQELKNQDLSLGDLFQNILDKLNYYVRPEDSFNGLGINQHINHFQKIIKLVVLGKNDNIFKDVSPKVRALQQPWFILITLSLIRSSQKSQKLRFKHHKQAIADYYNGFANNINNLPLDHELIINYVTGLLSLGQIKYFVELYKNLNEKCQLQTHQCYFDFVHIFIILLANPNLVYAQVKRLDANDIIERLLEEVVNYLKYLKMTKSQHFKNYFTLFLHISSHLSSLELDVKLQNIIEQLCSSLITKFQDLKLINSQDLSYLKQTDDVFKLFQRNIIKHIYPQNQQEYIELAQFCDNIKQPLLQEQILVKLLIFNYFQAEKIKNKLDSSGFLEREQAKLNETLFSKRIKVTEQYLERTVPIDRKEILNFIINLKKLRSYLLQRRKDLLRNEFQDLSRYRIYNQRVFKYLLVMESNQKSGIFDIFASYYQQLHQMYKLMYISSSSLDRYEKQRSSLLAEFKNIKDKYPSIAGLAYNKVVQSLKK